VIGRNDPNSMETPRRVAKAYVNDLWAGRYTAMSPITSFPSDGYDGIIIERNIPLTSMCSHHHQTIRWCCSYWLYSRRRWPSNWII
jgi:GTP cyclohydrolase I